MQVEAVAAEAPAPAISEAVPAVATPAAPTVEIPAAEQFDKALDAELKAVYLKNNPARDPITGEFMPRDEPAAAELTEATALEGTDAKPETVSADQPEGSKPEPAKPAIEPPHSWSAAEKAKWASVPPELQTYIAKRETEAHQAITRAGEQHKTLEQQVKSFEPFEQLIASRKDHFAKHGIAPVQAFAALLQTQELFEVNPVACLVQLGLQKGIDLRPVFAGHQQQAQVTADPRVAQLEGQIGSLNEKLAQFESKATEREKAELSTQQAEVAKVITDFAKDKPYFDDVRPLMKALLEGGQAKDLTDAYDMAINAKPDIRSRIQEDQRKADEDKRKAEDKARAEAARKAATVNVKSDQATRSTPKTMDDDLREIARRVYG